MRAPDDAGPHENAPAALGTPEGVAPTPTHKEETMSTPKPPPKPTAPQALTLADVTITWEGNDKILSMNGRMLARLLRAVEAECPTGYWEALFKPDCLGREVGGLAEACHLMASGDVGGGYEVEPILSALGQQLAWVAHRLDAGALGDGDWQRKFTVAPVTPAATEGGA